MTSDRSVLEQIRGGVVVSSQVMDPRSPLDDPRILAMLAQTGVLGGAVGARVAGPETVAELRAREPGLPIIAITKHYEFGTDNYITPLRADAEALVDAGGSVVAVQNTAGTRPAESFAEIADAVHSRGALVMADIATLDEARAAVRDGADMVGTTMFGYTGDTKGGARPPLALIGELVGALKAPVIAEGGLWTPEDVAACFAVGAHAVVVGSAVTAPERIVARMVAAAPRRGGETS
ncbi:N-acetylmannosamine-6-phosphate 2-epimerase [Acidipropionibacterium acidipropionici]|jgi:N-acylglucosamine-6-phosphate 2-epimerase|uniref:N-acylglucosamine-6-phosphate 2-epimerase n=1 Tax=Acidipropionibacterium acidipropionici TaxID=1748 RepID=A0AAC8YFM7_9ACTN|nr:putative N-acetylmannosamine-6-phosphate 2-epimerase [Acidipropionibacterium acidipropionici]AMS05812.1 hypothetical protein AXH35_10530 [Acidipropionibacterium acidipropionici]AOZ47279.1 hypothetical protein A8L58_11970 [Acidipropionibacterium acidipropionici]